MKEWYSSCSKGDAMKRKSGLISEAAGYGELLQVRRSELLAEMGADVPRLSELGRLAEDDQAPAEHDQFISLEVRRLGYQTLKQIDAALDRLATGDYGVCAHCGEAINPRRLTAIPWAAYCIQCQQEVGSNGEKVDEKAA
jgi:RNA polymerase-binding transcription factor